MEKQNENTKLLFNGALIIAGYFIIGKPILQKLGLQKDPEVVRTEQNNKDILDKWVADVLKVQQPTKSTAEWKIIADQIWEDLHYSSLDDNKDDATYQVCRVKNDADVAVLFKLFAKRREYAFGIPIGELKNLQEFITSNLSSSKLAIINNNYYRKGIKYRF